MSDERNLYEVVEGQRRQIIIGGRGSSSEPRDLTGTTISVTSTTPRVEVRNVDGTRVTGPIYSKEPFIRLYLNGLEGSGYNTGDLVISLSGPNVTPNSTPTVIQLRVVETPGAPDPEDVSSIGISARRNEPRPVDWIK